MELGRTEFNKFNWSMDNAPDSCCQKPRCRKALSIDATYEQTPHFAAENDSAPRCCLTAKSSSGFGSQSSCDGTPSRSSKRTLSLASAASVSAAAQCNNRLASATADLRCCNGEWCKSSPANLFNEAAAASIKQKISLQVDRLIPPLSTATTPFATVVQRVTSGDPLFVHLWMPILQQARTKNPETVGDLVATRTHSAQRWDKYWPDSAVVHKWLAEQLLQWHGDVFKTERNVFLNHVRLLACRIGPKQLFNALLSKRLLNATQNFGEAGLSALQIAALWGNCDLVDVFLQSTSSSPNNLTMNEPTKAISTACQHCFNAIAAHWPELVVKSSPDGRKLPLEKALDFCNAFEQWDNFLVAVVGGGCEAESLQHLTLELCRRGLSWFPLLSALFKLDKRLLTAPISSSDRNNFPTALGVAAESNNMLLLEVMLVLFKVPINAQFQSGQTALHIAAKNGYTEIVKILLIYGADPCVSDDDRYWPLDLLRVHSLSKQDESNNEVTMKLLKDAQSRKQAEIRGLLLTESNSTEMQEQISTLSEDALCMPIDDKSRSLLALAALRGNEPLVTKLLEHSAINQCALKACDAEGNTALSSAIIGNHIGIVQLLLEAGANGHCTNAQNQVPLEQALHYKLYDIFELMLTYPTCWTRLVTIIKATVRNTDQHYEGHHDFVLRSLKHAYDLRQRSIVGPLLFECATNGKVQTLVDVFEPAEDSVNPIARDLQQEDETAGGEHNKPGDVYAGTADEWPLFTAVRCGQKDVVSFLLQQGANYTNKHPVSKDTVFHVACWQTNTEILQILLDETSKTTLTTSNLQTESAPNTAHSSSIFLLDAVNRSGLTALDIAAYRVGNLQCVQLLLESGASAAGSFLSENCARKAAETTTSPYNNSCLVQIDILSRNAVELALQDAREKTAANLFEVVESGYPSRLQAALHSAFDLNLRNAAGDTPIMVAARLAAVAATTSQQQLNNKKNFAQVLQILLRNAVHERIEYVYSGEQFRNDGFVDWLIFNPTVRPPSSWQLEDDDFDDDDDDDPTTSSGTSSPNDIQDENDISESSKNRNEHAQLQEVPRHSKIVDIEALAQKRKHGGCWLARDPLPAAAADLTVADLNKNVPRNPMVSGQTTATAKMPDKLSETRAVNKKFAEADSRVVQADPPNATRLGLRRSKTMMTFADLRNSVQADQLRSDWNVLRFIQSLEIPPLTTNSLGETNVVSKNIGHRFGTTKNARLYNHVCSRSAASDGRTAVHRALATADSLSVLRLLIAVGGADAANIADFTFGFSPLHLAASLGRESCLLFLLDCGMCDLYATALDGSTPEEVASTPRLRNLIVRKRMNPFAPLPRAAAAKIRQKMQSASNSQRAEILPTVTGGGNDRTVIWKSRRNSTAHSSTAPASDNNDQQLPHRRRGTLHTLWLHGMSSALLSFTGRLSARSRGIY